MQQVAATTTIVNDSGWLKADQMPAFRAYLTGVPGVVVRDGGAGQFFHVRLPDLPRWLPIERGAAGVPVTPQQLRALVDLFVRGTARERVAERSVARAAFALPRECAPAEHVESLPGDEVLCTSALDYRRELAGEFKPLAEQRAALRLAKTLKPAPTEDAQYLSDLRDDFALHAPIPLPAVFTTEQFERHVIGRWAYADLMMKYRTAKAGD